MKHTLEILIYDKRILCVFLIETLFSCKRRLKMMSMPLYIYDPSEIKDLT